MYLLADFFVFLIVSVVVDYFAENYLFRSPTNAKKIGNREQLIEDDDENEDVAELRLWAENETESRHNSVTTRNLSKKYRNLTAVKNLSITIKPNECFGLLG